MEKLLENSQHNIFLICFLNTSPLKTEAGRDGWGWGGLEIGEDCDER
jgi:hypothetical protein